jgi:hypothetical protein
MKKIAVIIASLILFASGANAQKDNVRSKVAVLNLDTKSFAFDPAQSGNITRLELDKLDLFDVMDRYDIDYLLDKEKQNIADCYGKLCLVEVGKKIKADKMLTGTIELLGDRIVVTMRMIDVPSASVEKTQVLDFLNVKTQVQTMIGLTLRKMYKLPIDENTLNQLTQVNAFDTSVNTTKEEKVNLNGPRMGAALMTGANARILKGSPNQGGFEMSPITFQFGYQMEVQYIGQGNFQALVEFLPMITGLDQGKIIPSITILNGLRENRLGLEFAFGPTFLLTKKAQGFYDKEENWKLKSEWDSQNGKNPNPNAITSRADSRGEYTLSSGFVFAVGKTFRSGRLNIPVNTYVRPDYKNGSQWGVSFGFNARKYPKATN